MKVIETNLAEVKLIEPRVFEDERGLFFESFNQRIFEEIVGYPVTFVQDNHSRSVSNTIRGLHYQLPPCAQGKLVRVTKGVVFDVAVDIRKSSPTFGQWVGEALSADNRRQLWIPPGFAHGFAAIDGEAEFQYKCTQYYAPQHDRSIRWDDPDLSIAWPMTCGAELKISDKDFIAPTLEQATAELKVFCDRWR